MNSTLASNLVHFVRLLRGRGLLVEPTTAGELAGAAEVVGFHDRSDLKAAFCSVVVVCPTERVVFSEIFDEFFGGVSGESRLERNESEVILDPGASRAVAKAFPAVVLDDGDRGRMQETIGASRRQQILYRDFRTLSAAEAEEVRSLMTHVIWRPAVAVSRRWMVARGGDRPDMRASLGNLIGAESDLMRLTMARRKPRRRPLIVLADVSGSMERYTEMLLHFLHAAQCRLGRVEAFVFATHLSRITRQLRQRLPEVALQQVGSQVSDWSGGTRIGDCIETFNRDWSQRVARGGAIGLVISDGWDTGDPVKLGAEMARLSRSVYRLVWLNPLAGRPGYSPDTRGMQAALPHVDDLLAAGNLDDLHQVVRLLESVPARR